MPRTVLEIQAAQAAAAAKAAEDSDDEDDDMDVSIQLTGFGSSAGKNGKAQQAEDEDEEDSPNESDFAGSDDEENIAQDAKEGSTSTSTASASQPSISDLRARLQARIADSRTARGAPALPSPTASLDDSNTPRDALLEERRKKRGEVRDKRRKLLKERLRAEKAQGLPDAKKREMEESRRAMLATSSLKPAGGKEGNMSEVKKMLKKEGKRQGPAHVQEDMFAGTASAPPPVQKESAVSSTPSAASTSKAVVPAAPVAPAEPGSIAFSSLDFTPSSAIHAHDAGKLSKKQKAALASSSRTGITSSNPTIALAALQNRSNFLEKLTPAARERAEEKDRWERMALKASGTKVYDEEARLKKMVKRKEKGKEKSRKDWADRTESIKTGQEEKAKKRQENINERLKQRKDKKMGVKPAKSVGKGNPKKKGRPGFEGGSAKKRK